MFGHKSKLTETQKFVIAKGREVGNLKQAGPAFNKKTPLKAPVKSGESPGMKQGAQPFQSNRKSLGKQAL